MSVKAYFAKPKMLNFVYTSTLNLFSTRSHSTESIFKSNSLIPVHRNHASKDYAEINGIDDMYLMIKSTIKSIASSPATYTFSIVINRRINWKMRLQRTTDFACITKKNQNSKNTFCSFHSVTMHVLFAEIDFI